MTSEVKERIEQIRHGNVPDGFQETIFGLAPVSWRKNRIDEVCTLSSGSTPRRDNAENFIGDILWVTSGELKKRTIADTIEKISEDAAQKSNLTMYDPGTVVIAIYGLEAAGIRGTASIVGKRCTISQACMAFTEFNGVDNEFMYYWYLNNGQIIGLRYAQGTKQQNLSTDIVGAFPICYPEIREQREIAKILTTQDKVIELKEKLLAEKQRQKKYLMQHLLSGKKRLPGFSSEWKKNAIGSFIREVDEKTTENNQYDILSVTKNGIVRQFDHFNKQVASEDNTGYKILRRGNLAFSSMNLWMGSLDVLEDYEVGIISPAYKVFSFNTQLMNIKFGRQFMRSESMIWQYKVNSKQGASIVRRNLDLKALLSTKVSIPGLDEQQAIATVLMAADREIELLQQDIEYEKKKKKALMHLLLTGIVRVSV